MEQAHDTGTSERRHRRGWWPESWGLSDRVMVLGALALAAYCLLQLLLMRFGRDQGIYAVVADAMLSGGMPYRDAWDFKPPGVFLVYAMARGVFGPYEWSIRVLEALGFASLIPSFAVLAKRFFGDVRPGLMAASLAILIEAQMDFWHTAQPESFGGLLTVWGLLLTTRDASGERAGWKSLFPWIAGGVLFGVAGLMKPHMLGGAAVAGVHLAWTVRRQGGGLGQQLGALAAVGGGSLLALLGCLAWFVAAGAYGDLRETLFVFAPGYASTTWDSRWILRFVYQALKGWSAGLSAVMAVGMVLTVGLGPRAPREREGLVLLLAMALPQIVGIGIQSKFFAYHYGGVLPLGALLAAPGLFHAWRLARRAPLLGPVAYLVLLLAAIDARYAVRDLPDSWFERNAERMRALFAGSAEREAVAARLYSVADVHYGANMHVARWLTEHTTPEETVLVWGFEPHIYDAARRKPATRFIYNVAQRVSWDNQWAMDRLMDDLGRNVPRAVVVEHGDVFPMVTGNTLDSAQSLRTFPALEQLLRDGYTYVETIQDFDLYLRRPE